MIPATEAGAQQAMAATSAAAAVGAWWTMATDVASAVFGVPIQVVLAAFTGAFAARSLKTGTTYMKALGSGIVWAVVGIFSCQIAIWIMTKAIGEPPPTGAAAGAALLVSAGGQLIVTAELVDKIRKAVSRFIDGLWRKQ